MLLKMRGIEMVETSFASRNSRLPWIVGGGLFVLALGGGLYFATSDDKKALAEPAANPQTNAEIQQEDKAKTIPVVSVLAIAPEPVQALVDVTGTISARFDQPISVEGEGGRITDVLVEAGDRVVRGQVLARLSKDVMQAQVAAMAASLEEAQATAALAQADFARAQAVVEEGALSREEIERRAGQAATSAARARVVDAQLREMQARLARMDVRAPSSGVILARNAEVGQTATLGGTSLFRLGKGGEIELRGQAAEQDMPVLRVGQSVDVRVTGVDLVFKGQVRMLGPIIDPATRLGEVRIALPENTLLRPGAFAKATVYAGAAQAPILPQSAVQADAQGSYVLIVGADNKVSRRAIKVSGSTLKGVIIKDGVRTGERVVASAGAFLRVGELIKPVLAGAKS
jgi:HlyD family secretion protein